MNYTIEVNGDKSLTDTPYDRILVLSDPLQAMQFLILDSANK